ncbi:NADP-dependent oxidoreductase [Glutamicibacter uratoxydans]|uniref:NADP-dependent oxidoreductase n=1 Tax=Glutamicibacter uratoxydans TaxID=43667 RepID=A0A4Y4DJT6_GLUUR|nr:NADP-dependent oxidoreductase [Glutamicibacter uratoxydans]GED04823.1 NADP-dependent oxidoreductase [Glutamicibacter uratoxydans]
MTHLNSTQILLASRPTGWPTGENFEVRTVPLAELADGQVRVRNEFISVDPYMRGRMNDTRSYVAPYQIGGQISGGAVGEVIESRAPELPVGTLVLHQHGWSDVVQADAAAFSLVPKIPGVPNSLRLHMMGMTGLTAWVGLKVVAQMKAGDTVFISGAAGAVGTAAGQIAKLLGAKRVIGSAGSDAKVQLLKDKYGYDAAFNYKNGDISGQLHALAPEGIDVYFDNVGGEHLEAALDAFNDGGRGALCGAISSYNSTQPSQGPGNLANMITRGLKLQGFTLANYLEHAGEFSSQMGQWFAEGKIAYDETIVEGIEHTVEAFIQMMQGKNVGKMLVRI